MLSLPISILATSASGFFGLGAAILLFFFVFILAIYLFFAFCMAKIFAKAGKPGWAAFVPVYNTWLFFEIGGKPGWLSLIALLSFIPVLGIVASIGLLVISILVDLEIAKRFGKGAGFAICLLFLLPFIGLPILAFGKSEYHPPAGEGPVAATPPAGPVPPPQAGMSPPPSGPVATPGALNSAQPPTGIVSGGLAPATPPPSDGVVVSPTPSSGQPDPGGTPSSPPTV